MQDKMIENFNEQTRQLFEPMRKLNSLMLNNMEKLSQYQMESLKRYSQMGTERMRDASEVQDADSLRDFGTRQAEMMNELSQQMMADAKALSEMSLEFKAEMETLFTEQAKAMGEAAKQTSAADSDEPAKAKSSRGGSSKS
ncbi:MULTISPECIES: phasin family protein [unclassified Halomonas]|uniref:phasin family protein n=1 Tax=unclassified Halomonas TaxID=2609666 RepID=UPI0028839C3D|nr:MULTISPECIES: phasin family protein [unclassified Halomonas]MDT0501849.1 phasin family protein [Halomonas sp. PAR7]MDT0513520.1 phasin family protein [Halomonas sp. LES1]MDT0592558.1 phasin family protein [Halomonas sp. PAR8]